MKPIRHTADTLFAVLLLLIFSLFAFLLAGTGAAVYKNSASYLEENYTSRTAVAYTEEKIRQHDRAGSISLTTLDELPALCLYETIEQQKFVTYIYYFDGALRELFVKESVTPSAANGTAIVPLSSFSITDISDAEELLLEITACSEDGRTLSSVIHPVCQ